MPVNQLGYLGINVTQPEAWTTLASRVLGCEILDENGRERIDLRIDERHHRITLLPGANDSLAYLGFEVADSGALDAMANQLADADETVEAMSSAEAEDRRVDGLIRLRDPSGFACEIFFGAATTDRPLQSHRPISGFRTGRQGLGHVVLITPNYRETVEFYVQRLGFRVSDYIDLGNMDSTFLHCNERHHTVAVLEGPPGSVPTLHHFMLEVVDMNDVGLAYDLCNDLDLPITLTVGRHTNDLMTSFYLQTPSGFLVEYGYGGRTIATGEPWDVQRYGSPSLWGHRPALR